MTSEQIDKYSSFLKGNDLAFFRRVWATSEDIYLNRLKAINFQGFDTILDAGFGFGQWLLPLAKLNRNVVGVEFSEERFKVVSALVNNYEGGNVTVYKGSIEHTSFPDESFDAIFSYSVILCTDYRKTIKEFSRILKPGGKLYFNTNGLGWYLHNLLEGHNSGAGFSSQEMAIHAIENTIHYYGEGIHDQGKSIITPSSIILNDLKTNGFEKVKYGPEGTVKENNHIETIPFFKGEYYGHEGVIEFICTKK